MLFGASPFGVHPFGGPGLVSRRSERMPVTSVITRPPVPGPPKMPVTSIITSRHSSATLPVTSILQGAHKFVIEIINADLKEGGNPVYDRDLTL